MAAARCFLSDAKPYPKQSSLTEEHEKDRMELHRAVLRGTGFYAWQTKHLHGPDTPSLTTDMAELSLDKSRLSARPLLSTNFLDTGDVIYDRVVIEKSAFPQDRDRLANYLKHRQCNVALLTGVSGPLTSSLGHPLFTLTTTDSPSSSLPVTERPMSWRASPLEPPRPSAR